MMHFLQATVKESSFYGKIFHELVRGAKSRREFLQEILDVLSLTGGELSDAR